MSKKLCYKEYEEKKVQEENESFCEIPAKKICTRNSFSSKIDPNYCIICSKSTFSGDSILIKMSDLIRAENFLEASQFNKDEIF